MLEDLSQRDYLLYFRVRATTKSNSVLWRAGATLMIRLIARTIFGANGKVRRPARSPSNGSVVRHRRVIRRRQGAVAEQFWCLLPMVVHCLS